MKITTHATSLSKRLAFTTIILALVFACTTHNSPEPQSVTKLQDGMLSLDDAAKITEKTCNFSYYKNGTFDIHP